MTSKNIRKTYLEFFKSKGHQIVPSAPLVIKNDPTLMFTNAGMNQFKDYFLGNAEPKHRRVADTQKCLRVSGKHNDLEDVGHDTYHHTMFEMLGNWSFGDYFKKEAIEWSWELLTKHFKIDPEIIYATVFEGSKDDKLEADMESFELWKQFLPEERILFGNKKDNFWEMGDTGPCGPCTEIHLDLRANTEKAQKPGRDLVNNDHPQVIEVWNNVFMEFNRNVAGQLNKLPAQHVDTGMGFERLCMAIQGKTSNYDTDVFTPLLDKIGAIAKVSYGQDQKVDIAMRVIADHVRAVAFAIADGQLPSNNKAGYVIRRILRRAIRYGYSFLNLKEPFIFNLVEVLSGQFDEVFPELTMQKAFISKVVHEEEANFLRTLDSGLRKLDGYFESSKKQEIEGEVAFELYDTFGFPLDLTALIARERGMAIEEDGFTKAMEAQKSRSRNAAQVELSDWTVIREGESEFIGYDSLEAETQVLRFRYATTKGEKQLHLVLASNPFYAESGGQVGDKGVVEFPSGVVEVFDTKKENGISILFCDPVNEEILKEKGIARVNADLRTRTASNHSATHLLHAALKNHLGNHVQQKGSLVSEELLRFDFAHPSRITKDELQQIEHEVNTKIREAIPLTEERFVPLKEAQDRGVTALFGEKYGDLVRVISFDPNYSSELCSGTHVPNTANIGLCKIVSEGSVSAGVRRIAALTGPVALEYLDAQASQLEQIQDMLGTQVNPVQGVAELLERNKTLENRLKELEAEKTEELIANLSREIKELGARFAVRRLDVPADTAKNIAFKVGSQNPEAALVIGGVVNDKPMLTVFIGKALQESSNLDARQIVKELSRHIEGGGGGQAFFATAGGKNVAGIDKALSEAALLFSKN